MGIASNDSVLQFKQTLERRIANDTTKSRLKRITERAVEIFTEYRDAQVHELFPLLDKFRFKSDQRRSLHAAITGAAEESPQMERLLELNILFKDYAEQYTLKFADGEIQTSKAELYTYGNYFKAQLNSGVGSELRTIDLTEIVRVKKVTLTSRIAKLFGSKAVITEPMPLKKETFETIINFLRGKVELDFEDQDTYETITAISGYLQIKDFEERYYTSIDEAIVFVRNFEVQKIDLMKYEGELTDSHIDQILTLPSLPRVGEFLDLRALFPNLQIEDELEWQADPNTYGLKVNGVVDQRAAIRELYKRFRRGATRVLLIKNGAPTFSR